MAATQAHQFETRDAGRASSPRPPGRASSPRPRSRRSTEQRRRERHFARRRRDLLEDVGLALLLTLTLVSLTAGLGVIALLEIPMAGILLASVVVPRVRRRRLHVRSRPGRRVSRRG